MARFVIIAMISLSPVTYLFEDPDKALAKLRTFQRNFVEFTISDDQGRELTVADVERALEES